MKFSRVVVAEGGRVPSSGLWIETATGRVKSGWAYPMHTEIVLPVPFEIGYEVADLSQLSYNDCVTALTTWAGKLLTSNGQFWIKE